MLEEMVVSKHGPSFSVIVLDRSNVGQVENIAMIPVARPIPMFWDSKRS